MIRIGHPAYLIAQSASHSAGAALVFLTTETQFEFHCSEPRLGVGLRLAHQCVLLTFQSTPSIKARRIRLNAGTKGASHHLVDRQSCGLPLDIPESDIDAAESLDDCPFLSVIA